MSLSHHITLGVTKTTSYFHMCEHRMQVVAPATSIQVKWLVELNEEMSTASSH